MHSWYHDRPALASNVEVGREQRSQVGDHALGDGGETPRHAFEAMRLDDAVLDHGETLRCGVECPSRAAEQAQPAQAVDRLAVGLA